VPDATYSLLDIGLLILLLLTIIINYHCYYYHHSYYHCFDIHLNYFAVWTQGAGIGWEDKRKRATFVLLTDS
jgi:hypothetical protein